MNVDPAFSKPLPPPLRDDLPPIPHHDNDLPPVPPHFAVDEPPNLPHTTHNGLNPIDTGALSPRDGLHVPPLTPISPVDPSAPPSPGAEGKSKKRVNPLTDLIETEKVYVDLLTGIMRKVAAAWSRQNLPPPELDKMFRNIEAVYKANRGLLGKLKEIGTNPSSPKALGDLLMRWIGDLDAPYTKYSETFISGFDDWDPVQSNTRLRTTLAMFSASNPPPLPPSAPEHPSEPPLWTVDSLFLLPKGRLRYYRKLYSRLMKSTTPGRTDHRLLTGALEKLDSLLATLDQRGTLKVGGLAQPAPPPPPPMETEDEVVIDLRTRNSTMPLAPPSSRGSDSVRSSDSPSANRSSQDTAPTSVSRGSASSFTSPVTDLERRLSMDRCLDIFTMQPKQVKLQIAPPGLHYARELKASVDVVMQLVPRSTGVEVTQERGHVFILTDLLLMCERMSSQDRAAGGPDGPDMWLLYPPLAGKHLRVAPVDGSDTALAVTILRKETVTMYTNSRKERDDLVAEFMECIDRAAILIPSKGQQPPPPVPKLPSTSDMHNMQHNMQRQPSFGPGEVFQTSPPSRVLSPSSMPPSRSSSERGQSPPVNGMARMGMGGEPPSRMGSMSNHQEGSYPQRSNSFSPGQIMPPGPGQIMQPGGFGPGQVMPPMHGNPMMGGPAPGQYAPPPRGASYGAPQGGPPNHYGPGPGLPSQPGMSRVTSPYGPPGSRPPSDGSMNGPNGLRKSTSSRSLASDFDRRFGPGGPGGPPPPPMPGYPNDLAPPNLPFMHRNDSSGSLSSLGVQQPRPILPSAAFSVRSMSTAPSFADPSPPTSPVEEAPQHTGPTTSTVSAQMKCKVFLKEHHAKWKSLGSAKLRLFRESPTNIKQLVVEADNSKKNVLISTIVLADGVERVGKTGVAIELSDRGQRTGVVYMLQLRNESSAGGLFESLLAGSDRSEVTTGGRP